MVNGRVEQRCGVRVETRTLQWAELGRGSGGAEWAAAAFGPLRPKVIDEMSSGSGSEC